MISCWSTDKPFQEHARYGLAHTSPVARVAQDQFLDRVAFARLAHTVRPLRHELDSRLLELLRDAVNSAVHHACDKNYISAGSVEELLWVVEKLPHEVCYQRAFPGAWKGEKSGEMGGNW